MTHNRHAGSKPVHSVHKIVEIGHPDDEQHA